MHPPLRAAWHNRQESIALAYAFVNQPLNRFLQRHDGLLSVESLPANLHMLQLLQRRKTLNPLVRAIDVFNLSP